MSLRKTVRRSLGTPRRVAREPTESNPPPALRTPVRVYKPPATTAVEDLPATRVLDLSTLYNEADSPQSATPERLFLSPQEATQRSGGVYKKTPEATPPPKSFPKRLTPPSFDSDDDSEQPLSHPSPRRHFTPITRLDRPQERSGLLFSACKTPERTRIRAETGQLPTRNVPQKDPMLDKERIANTPSKEKNDEWLEGFGIDISLLRLTDELPGAENSHPNITPSKSDGKVQPSPERIPHAKSSKDTTASAPLPLEGCITPKARRTRRYTDIFEEARSGVVHPGLSCSRAVSVRKHRRASVRVSSREMRGIMDGKVDGGEDMRNRTTGTEVCLTPVRASRKQREELGADIVVTPVRRSLRLTRRRESDLPTSAILEANNFAFAPNRNL